jgi:hypothetical protein
MVKNAIRHTMAILLAGFFLVSFTGVRLLVHHCLGCNLTEVAIAGIQHDCCQTNQDGDEHTCCTKNGHQSGSNNACNIEYGEGCCDLETIYLKGDFELISERTTIKIETPVVAALDVAVETIADSGFNVFNQGAATFEEPPPRLTGRDFVLYSHQLKIS